MYHTTLPQFIKCHINIYSVYVHNLHMYMYMYMYIRVFDKFWRMGQIGSKMVSVCAIEKGGYKMSLNLENYYD